MIKIISIKADKTEHKQDTKGKPCINYQVQALLPDGEQKSAYITSYAGELRPGMELDMELKEQTSKKTGKTYLSGYYYPPKGQAYTPPAAPAPVQQKSFTPEELEGVMEKCIDFGYRQIERLKAFGVDGLTIDKLTSIINSLYIAQTSHGHRPNDWLKLPKDDFANPNDIEKEQLINQIKDWLKEGKITDSTLKATRTLHDVGPLESATLEQVKKVYNGVKPDSF